MAKKIKFESDISDGVVSIIAEEKNKTILNMIIQSSDYEHNSHL